MRTLNETDDSSDVRQASSREDRLVQCVKEYQQALQAGEASPIKQIVAQHADLAPDLQECLEALTLMAGIEGTTVRTGRTNDTPHATEQMQATPKLIGALNSQPIGDFQIIAEIGRGGMGVVYEARQLSLGRRVALKVLPLAGALEPVQLQRFRNEAQAAASLHHPHIVPVYAVGCERGMHYYAMQLIEGHSCADVIQQQRDAASDGSLAQSAAENDPAKTLGSRSTRGQLRKQAVRRVVEWITQAALALEYAHQFGVVHRDIKPANLLIDQAGNLWVTDFGLAQFQNDSKLTKTGDMVGTLRYMSPEQIEGGNRGQDLRTDIYALGATLFELLTLRPFIIGQSYGEIVQHITQCDPPTARGIRADIPRELDTIIQKATARQPSDRYRTMRELAEDLSRWMNDEPILAQPPTIFERLSKWHRRHWLVVNSLMVGMVLCTLALAWTTRAVLHEQTLTRQALQSERAERLRAEQALREAKRAVDVFTQLGESELVHLPELRKLRGDFLSTALTFYREFVELEPNNADIETELRAAANRIQAIVADLEMLNSIDPLLMLRYTKVQREIELDTKTWQNLEPLVTELSERLQSNAASSQSESQFSELKSLIASTRRYLSDSQLERLRQLHRQNGLPMIFRSLEVASELNLSLDQRARIQQIISEESGKSKPPLKPRPNGAALATDANRPLTHEPRPRPASPWASAQVRRSVERILQVLTDDQRKRWNQLIGEPF